MAVNLSIVKPVAVTNLCTNPSAETNATGWATAGTSVAQSSDFAAFGAYSIKLITGSASSRSCSAPGTTVNGTTYIIAAYMKRSDSGVLSVTQIPTAIVGSTTGAPTFQSVGNGWYRVYATIVGGASTTTHGWNFTYNGTVYIDGVDIYADTVLQTHCDGDQPGCRWTGTAHGSTSTRDAQSREGGQIVTIYSALASVPTSYFDAHIAMIGFGMPPVDPIGVENMITGGEQYQRTLRKRRVLTLQEQIEPSSLVNYHAKRQNIINLVKSDLVFPEQPFWLRYYNDDSAAAGSIARIKCVYESGLEGNARIKSSFAENIALRLNALDPLFYEEVDTAAVLGYNTSISNANGILQRSNAGIWTAMGTGETTGQVRALLQMPNGDIIAGGSFTSMGGVANTSGIARWDGSAWNAMGTGVSGGTTVYGLALDAAGNLYAAGAFTAMGGVANTNKIAKWDGSTWSSISSGFTGTAIWCLRADRAGNIYAGGIYSNIGGTAAANIAKYNGSAWSALSTGLGAAGANSVYSMVVDAANNLYACGDFTSPQANIAKWNGAAFSALGTGITGGSSGTLALAIGADGTLYAGGDFTTAGGVACAGIAKWNGTAFTALGAGISAATGVFSLAVAANGALYVGGNFTTAGGITLVDGWALWSGSAWLLPDVDLPGSGTVYAILQPAAGGLVLGFTTNGTATGTTVTTTTVTVGTAAVAPKVFLTGPGTFIQLVNVTTGQIIQFNALTLLAGETAVLDLTPDAANQFVSSFRGNLMNYLLAANQLATWKLLPGANSISVYITGGTAATLCNLVWRNANWACDFVT